MIKELVPITTSYVVCGPLIQKSSTEFHSDNQGLVTAINMGSSKDTLVMHLVKCSWFFTAAFDIHITATYISGNTNNIAYMLSKNQTKAHPNMPSFPIPLLSSFVTNVSTEAGLDLPNTPQTFQENLRTFWLNNTPMTV